MISNFKKTTTLIFLVVVVFGLAVATFFFLNKKEAVAPVKVEESKKEEIRREVIGKSVQGRDIESFTYGSGQKKLVLVGGIHGGYEWNSVLLAYQVMDYLEKNPAVIPSSLSISVIPSANPDAVYKVVGKEGRFEVGDVSKDENILVSARFNANQVDLNRNFDCDWKPEATWRSKKVSAGTEPFSEPESKTLQQFFVKNNPVGAVFWHSQANAVYAGDCKGVILPKTLEIMDLYANASGYVAQKTFDSYEVNGASDGWLTTIGIPTLTVELKTHESVEFDQNLLGVKALIEYYGKN
ncbi:MAG: M14 family metallopeptidase [Candidatus Paceibacterota bacterium]